MWYNSGLELTNAGLGQTHNEVRRTAVLYNAHRAYYYNTAIARCHVLYYPVLPYHRPYLFHDRAMQ
jgi:hypothetical protein